jgi:hypothetical protein
MNLAMEINSKEFCIGDYEQFKFQYQKYAVTAVTLDNVFLAYTFS